MRQAGDTKDNPIKLNAVRTKVTKKQYRNPRGGRSSTETLAEEDAAALVGRRGCSRCGGQPHPSEKCPARDATCFRCQKKGHYSARCFSNVPESTGAATDTVEVIEETEPAAYLDVDAVNIEGPENSWMITVRVNQIDLTFKLDTGAEVTAISEWTHRLIGKPALLKIVIKILSSLFTRLFQDSLILIFNESCMKVKQDSGNILSRLFVPDHTIYMSVSCHNFGKNMFSFL